MYKALNFLDDGPKEIMWIPEPELEYVYMRFFHDHDTMVNFAGIRHYELLTLSYDTLLCTVKGFLANDPLYKIQIVKNNEIDFSNVYFYSEEPANDPVNHPAHYTEHLSGVECIQITEHFNFCLGNAIKYIWRADEKDNPIEDLRKAIWYINREIERRTKDG